MNAQPPESKPRPKLPIAAVAFVAGYLGGYFLWNGLIALSHPDHPWWAFWRADAFDITVFTLVGLCTAAVSLLIRKRPS